MMIGLIIDYTLNVTLRSIAPPIGE